MCVFEGRPRYVYIPNEWREKALSVLRRRHDEFLLKESHTH